MGGKGVRRNFWQPLGKGGKGGGKGKVEYLNPRACTRKKKGGGERKSPFVKHGEMRERRGRKGRGSGCSRTANGVGLKKRKKGGEERTKFAFIQKTQKKKGREGKQN